MTELTASRTLVKSPPELWAECSDAASLSRHLDHFGEIRITRLEPETAVAWEGEHASGTVRLEPAGWGTRVVLTALPVDPAEPQPAGSASPSAGPAEPAPAGSASPPAKPPEAVPPALGLASPELEVPPPEPEAAGAAAEAAPAQAAKPGLLARMRSWWQRRKARRPGDEVAAPEAEPEPQPAGPEPEPQPAASAPEPLAPPDPVTVAPAGTRPGAALEEALDSLGQAHHRPYSRA